MSDISEALIQQVDNARIEKRRLKIVGGDSKSFYGRETDGEVLSLKEHRGIVSYHPVELVITARAGTTLAEIDTVLAEHQQMLSFEAPEFTPQSTIGGTLACNFSGPGRPWLGSVRDQLLGVRLINGKAEHLRFGGQVMKNVAGYDVSRLQAGALGTLGAITEISFKVLPRPQASCTLRQPMEMQEAISLMNRHSGESRSMTAACWWQGALYIRLSGSQKAVSATLARWSGELMTGADEFWQQLRDHQLAFFSAEKPLWRFSVKSSSDGFLPQDDWLIDWGGAQRWLRGDQDFVRLQGLAEQAQGQVSCYRGGDRQAERFHPQPRALQLIQQRLKQAFDPAGIFNAGRLYSWL